MKFTLILVVFVSQYLNPSLPVWAEQPEYHPLVHEIIDQELQWTKQVQTLYSKSVWETTKGSEQRYHHTTLRKDNNGRVRYLAESGNGLWGNDARSDKTREWINTGEAVFSIRVSPIIFSDGSPIQYISQQIRHNAEHRIPIRDPISLGRIANQLQAVMKSGGRIVVKSGSDGVKNLEWIHPANNENWSAEIIRIEGKPCVKKRFSKMPEGELGGSKTIIEKYRRDESGVLVPERASSEFQYTRSMLESLEKLAKIQGKPKPDYKKNVTKFTLLDLRINAPDDFPDGTFEVK